MIADSQPVRVGEDSELGKVLRRAASGHQSVLVDTGAALYRIDVQFASTGSEADDGGTRDSVLNIIGLGQSVEESDIAVHKDRYVAESIEPQER